MALCSAASVDERRTSAFFFSCAASSSSFRNNASYSFLLVRAVLGAGGKLEREWSVAVEIVVADYFPVGEVY